MTRAVQRNHNVWDVYRVFTYDDLEVLSWLGRVRGDGPVYFVWVRQAGQGGQEDMLVASGPKHASPKAAMRWLDRTSV